VVPRQLVEGVLMRAPRSGARDGLHTLHHPSHRSTLPLFRAGERRTPPDPVGRSVIGQVERSPPGQPPMPLPGTHDRSSHLPVRRGRGELCRSCVASPSRHATRPSLERGGTVLRAIGYGRDRERGSGIPPAPAGISPCDRTGDLDAAPRRGAPTALRSRLCPHSSQSRPGAPGSIVGAARPPGRGGRACRSGVPFVASRPGRVPSPLDPHTRGSSR
jgi:hypothetical protein